MLLKSQSSLKRYVLKVNVRFFYPIIFLISLGISTKLDMRINILFLRKELKYGNSYQRFKRRQ